MARTVVESKTKTATLGFDEPFCVTNMSFSVSVDNTNFEYCGKGLSGIFSNKSNLFNIEFLKMFFDIIKF